MIQQIDISGVRYTADETTKKYVLKKIGRLDRYVSRHARKTMAAEVVLKEVNRANGNKYECTVKLTLPGKTLTAQDSTMNMLAAVDIVEAKLADQLRKYKETHQPVKGWRARVARLKQRVS